MPGNKECDQLIPYILGGKTSPCFWITAFQHSIQQVSLIFTAILPLFDQLRRVSMFSSRRCHLLHLRSNAEGPRPLQILYLSRDKATKSQEVALFSIQRLSATVTWLEQMEGHSRNRTS
jgi:hypothetical protein